MSKPGKSELKTIRVDFVDGEKRQHLPFLLRCTCDECGRGMEQDLSDDRYLSYPALGNTMNPAPVEHVTMYCMECDHEQSYQVRVVVSIEVVS